MRIGLAKVDITPRVGVELCGFGPFLNRKSIAVRDRLWARAMAVEHAGRRVVIVSCDLLGLPHEATEAVWARVSERPGLAPHEVMITCTHTHSGPNTRPGLTGWGECDPPYIELLPRRIAEAVAAAVEDMAEAELLHAESPCEGIGLNREQDRDAPPLTEVLREDWRPAKPELTDTTCHVLKVVREGRVRGFVSCFSCHPVVCCQRTRYIHGDFVGVATNLVEREHPGSVGLFLQGAHGDINSCVVHKPEQEAMLALDVIVARYACAVRRGLDEARPLEVGTVGGALHEAAFTRRPWTAADVRRRLTDEEAKIVGADSDDDGEYRMAVVRKLGLERILARIESGVDLASPVTLHGLRIGPLVLLGSPFEMFRQIKTDVQSGAKLSVPLVVSMADGSLGYAPDRFAQERGGYAADQVPLMYGIAPFAELHKELPAALLALEAKLTSAQ
jgi:Neutral/alkaline non-lysosomal ceramidase, N-terminal